MLQMVTKAADRSLLTVAELRAAIGADLDDAALRSLGVQVSDMIAIACNVARAGAAPPTLRQETLKQRLGLYCGVGLLGRRFAELVAVNEVDTPRSIDAFEVDFATGEISAVDGNAAPLRLLEVTFKAGFDEVPADLKHAALAAAREIHSAAGRDPLLRAETTDDLGRLEYQVGGTARLGTGALPALTQSAIATYVRPAFG